MMNGKHTLAVFSLLATAIFIILWLKNSTYLPNVKNNGFKRKWIENLVVLEKEKNISSAFARFPGTHSGYNFLATKDPFVLVKFSEDLNPKDTFTLNLPKINASYNPNILVVDSFNVLVALPNSALSFTISLDSEKIDSVRLQSDIFTRFSKMRNSSAIVRALTKDQTRQSFKKIDLKSGEVIKEASIVENDKSYMGFDSDGILQFDPIRNLFIYVQYYRNEVHCFDTSLNLIYKSNTIDTISTNSAVYTKLEKFDSQKVTSSAARLIVNRECIVDSKNGVYFILSNLRSDDATNSDFRENNTLDIYKIDDGMYLGSFTIPKRNSTYFLSATIDSSHLLVLNKGNLAKYRIDYSKLLQIMAK
ncbi:hypothetical protein [Chitinophaga sp. XS-30]|uniref:hypothetical protein n=1 Tax=Chitinophaga sp. XS-30 TaxID=2604421 RepID=UPI0011DE1932|nr:hypothetical protein [Chitinophaga sp. XS-30]QEH43182.1 hypothetical protein FW415_20845 [Chitinophaga sp. XS-30]